ncbi:MAG TPA: NfeD family protein [Bacteroidales bacterium]|jgi:membrane-bound ClpP family serine protease|nr:NfeD family protein [Bacteroidales bacterium]HXK90680.1 NfeD family protein [Bacteroidales bacterium]
MNLTTIIIIIIAGLLLLLLELIVPGGIVGTIGGIATIVGIVLMYNHYGNLYGTIALLVSLIVCAVGLYFFFRDKTWKRLALNDSIDIKLNKKEMDYFTVGMQGETITKCLPSGKARFDDKIVEVHSLAELIDSNTPVEITKIEGNKIIVKPINS